MSCTHHCNEGRACTCAGALPPSQSRRAQPRQFAPGVVEVYHAKRPSLQLALRGIALAVSLWFACFGVGYLGRLAGWF